MLQRTRAAVSGVALLAATIAGGSSASAQVKVPTAKSTAAEAAADFDSRKLSIVQFNACGREGDFGKYVNEIRAGNYENQGEGLTWILSAKVAHWYMDLGPCRFVEQSKTPTTSIPSAEPHCRVYEVGQNTDGTFAITHTLSRECLRQQINLALLSYRRHHQLGSSKLTCYPFLPNTTEGEWDVNVREIVRVYYLANGWPGWRGRRVLDPETNRHIMNELLTVRGSPGPASYSVLYDCGNMEEETGSAEDYADRQDWIDRAVGSLGNALDYLSRRFSFLLFLLQPFLAPYLGVGALNPAVPLIVPTPIAAGAAGTGSLTVLDPFTFARVPETENHRFNIESSRYLINQAMLAQLGTNYPNADVVRRQQGEVKDWLLHRLQEAAKHDFEEYNSRAYQRYSINAILNLYDFAFDPDVVTAAQIVVDAASAKFAIGSNRARRFAPFRRVAGNDGSSNDPDLRRDTRDLYNYRRAADHQVPRFLMLAGQTQLLRDELPKDGIGELVNPATSKYRLPPVIMELAVERKQTYLQRFHHTGVEVYAGGPGYLISAGGIRTPKANTWLGLGMSEDRGVAMPTVVIPTTGGLTLDDLIRFEGRGVADERRDNACVTRNFACGLNLVIPEAYNDCVERVATPSRVWTFISSVRCNTLLSGPGDAFYLAAFSRECSWYDEVCERGGVRNYGFIEIADAPKAVSEGDPSYLAFKKGRTAALDMPDDRSTGTYVTSAGVRIVFDVLGSQANHGGIVGVSGGSTPSIEHWPFGEGSFVTSSGDGLIVITNPDTKHSLTLDYRIWNQPKRIP